MQLPASLQQALEELASKVPITSLRAAYQQLSESYHRGENSLSSFHRADQVLAYLLARMPATYAAIYKALKSVRERLPDWKCESILDLGAGPGTASWAAAELFDELKAITLLEQSGEMLSMGKTLASYADQEALRKGEWLQQNLRNPFSLPRADLAIFSYVCSEIDCLDLIIQLWKEGAMIVVIEPGTPKGFANILSIRNSLLKIGAFLAAPCPHHFACPTASWCHFPARVERTKAHKLLKEGSLGYEDEKYSYIALSPFPCPPIEGRIVDKPLKLPGHVKLSICTKEGILEQKVVSKKQKEFYRDARDLEWSSQLK
jgi:ribosomal protein RSM22 (predicted rRNA methylase)